MAGLGETTMNDTERQVAEKQIAELDKKYSNLPTEWQRAIRLFDPSDQRDPVRWSGIVSRPEDTDGS